MMMKVMKKVMDKMKSKNKNWLVMMGMNMNRLVNSNSILEIMEIMEMEMCMSTPNKYKCKTIKNNCKCKSTKKNSLHLSTKDNNNFIKNKKRMISHPTTSTANNNI